MTYWAEIDELNVVKRVLRGDSATEDEGLGWLLDNLGGTWVMAKYTDREGNTIDPDTGQIVVEGESFRYNYPSIGSLYIPDAPPNGAFTPPRSNASLVLDEKTYTWVNPE